MSRSLLSVLVAVLALVPAVQADAPDPRIDIGLYRALDVGSALYNGGQHEACFRVYQGALLAVVPQLDGMPELMKKAQAGLDRAAGLRGTPAQRATALRAVIDEVRAAFRKPLWDRLGGEAAVTAVVHDFVMAAAPDPKVNFFRNGAVKLDADGVAKLERRLVELVSAVSGGPLKYGGRGMKAAHAGMKITDAEFDALAGHLVATLKKYKVPDAELNELVTIVASTRKDIVGQ